MTTRLCFFGNSHLAAIREAWRDDRSRWPGIDATFIGAHKGLLLETEIKDRQLAPATDAAKDAFRRFGGVDTVDLSAYDGFVVAGCLVAMPQAALAYQSMRWTGLPSLTDIPDLAQMEPRLVSFAAARASVTEKLLARLGPAFIRHLRQGTDRPIWLSGCPRLAERFRHQKRPKLRAYAAALHAGDGAALSALYEDAARAAVAAAGGIFIPQPPETILDDILTDDRYMLGAKRLTARGNAAQPEDDLAHGNAAFGAAVLDQVAGLVS